MKLSIIIPVYNVEKYVEKCIRSCENQDIPKEDYEVIVVNDGSPDGSLAIVERVAKEHPNIKVISQENQGLSGARNTGLAAAQGEYVWFVDSDDWIEENCLKGLTEKLVDNLDILHIRFKNAYEDGTYKVPEQRFLDGIHSGKEITEQGGLAAPAQFSVLRSKFVKDNNLKFYVGIYHEDAEFKPKAVYLANSIRYYDKEVYYYLQRNSGSITSNYKLKNGLDAIKVCNSLYDFTKLVDPEYKVYFSNRVASIIYTHLYRYKKLPDTDKVKMIECLKENKHLFGFMLKSRLIKNKVAAILLTLNPKVAVFVFSIIVK